MLKNKKVTTQNARDDAEKMDYSYMGGKNIKWYSQLKTDWQCLKLTTQLPKDSGLFCAFSH